MFANESLSTRSHGKEKDGTCNRSLRHKIPYRLLGRRSMGTKRLVLSSKVLLSAIPTHNCDVVLTFPASTDDSTLMWLLARLKSRKPALTVSVRHHSNSGIYGFYLTADYDSLLQGAEELAILKPLKTEYGGGMKEFAFEDQDCFAGVEDEETFLTSQERQSIVLQFLNDLRATGDDTLNGIAFVESQPIVPLLKTKKVISQVFPLHNSNDLKELRQTWVQALFSPQPLDLVRRYFGMKIALYFAYLGHYTTWLIVPAILGLLIFLLQGTDQFMEDISFLCFAFFNVIWASLYLKFWSRASTEFSYRLGMLEKKDDLMKDPRPLFKGELMKSPVTGHLEPTYPAWKRSLFFYTITAPIIGLCLLVVFVTMLLCFELQEWVNDLMKSSDLPYVLSFGPKILLAVVVSILDEIYKQIALWLTDKENYRLEETFETNLITKLVLFQFVNSFLSLFYIGFYLGDMDRLRDQLAALLITRQVLGNLKETLMPYITWKAKLYTFGYRIATKMSPDSVEKEVRKMTTRKRSVDHSTQSVDKSAGKTPSDGKVKQSDDESSTGGEDEGIPTLTQAEVESAMKKYEDTLDDYLEMCIQFGYITLFSSAFPLAALCALVNNIIEIRSDAFKLCLTFQRPFGQRVENIGIWQDVLEYIAILAVIVNCILMSTTGVLSRLLPGLTPTTSFFVLVVIEHLIITLKLAIARAIPDMPQTISTEMAKLEYQRREALKKLESQATSLHQAMSQQPSGSPGLFRRRMVEGSTNKDDALLPSLLSSSPSMSQSPSSNQASASSTSSVITPSSFNAAACSSGTTLNPSSNLQSFLPPSNMPKPEVPPRTSLLRNNKSDDSFCSASNSSKKPPQIPAALPSSSSSSLTLTPAIDLAADKVVAAAMQPILGTADNPLDNKKSTNTNMPYLGQGSVPQSHQAIHRVQVQLRPRPVVKDEGEQRAVGSVSRRYLRRRLDLDARRGVSDPVTGAVSTALRLHHDRDAKLRMRDGDSNRDNDGDGSSTQLVRSSCESPEMAKERRQDLLRRSLHNMAQREELRRTASYKHPKRVSDKELDDSSKATTITSANVSLRSISYSRPKTGMYYSSQFLSHKSRSLSSENIQEPSFSWRDRHSWKAEETSLSSEGKRHSPKSDRNSALASSKSIESPLLSKQSTSNLDKPQTASTTINNKPPSGLPSDSYKQSSSLASEAVAAKTEDSKRDNPEPALTTASNANFKSQNITSINRPSSMRAVRDNSNQPLSISTDNLNPN